MTYSLKYACISRRGRRRKNQDNLCVDGLYLDQIHNDSPIQAGTVSLDSPHTFGVFDGLGGECDGETASFMAARYLSENMDKIHEEQNPFLIKKAIGRACLAMNQEICDFARLNKYSAMGTTLAGVTVLPDMVYGYNLGDSRIYRFSESGLKQYSRDHVSNGIFFNVGLTQYLGIPETEFIICPDTFYEPVKDKDLYLICSDGLSNLLSDEVINDILRSYSSPTEVLEVMLSEAETLGLKDNTTGILLQIEKE